MKQSLYDFILAKKHHSLRSNYDVELSEIYSKAGLIPTAYDELTLLRYEGDESITVNCFDSGCKQSSLYDWSKLGAKDKYSIFLGGNHGRLSVREADATKPRLLLIKDSFANAVLPLLARHYDVTIIDPRYYRADLSSLLEQEHFDAILILFGADTLATTNVSKSFSR